MTKATKATTTAAATTAAATTAAATKATTAATAAATTAANWYQLASNVAIATSALAAAIRAEWPQLAPTWAEYSAVRAEFMALAAAEAAASGVSVKTLANRWSLAMKAADVVRPKADTSAAKTKAAQRGAAATSVEAELASANALVSAMGVTTEEREEKAAEMRRTLVALPKKAVERRQIEKELAAYCAAESVLAAHARATRLERYDAVRNGVKDAVDAIGRKTDRDSKRLDEAALLSNMEKLELLHEVAQAIAGPNGSEWLERLRRTLANPAA